jgi:hypothetical protein
MAGTRIPRSRAGTIGMNLLKPLVRQFQDFSGKVPKDRNRVI